MRFIGPTPAWVIDPQWVADLADCLVGSTPGRSVHSPLTGSPLGVLPLANEHDIWVAASEAEGYADRSRPQSAPRALRKLRALLGARDVEVADIAQVATGVERRGAITVPMAFRRAVEAAPRGRRLTGSRSPISHGRVHLRVADGASASALGVAAYAALARGWTVTVSVPPYLGLVAAHLVSLARECGVPDEALQAWIESGPAAPAQVPVIDVGPGSGHTWTWSSPGRRSTADAVDALVRSAYTWAGQDSLDHVDLPRPVFDRLIGPLVEKVRGLQVGRDLTFAADVGPLLDRDGLTAVSARIATLLDGGGHLLCGGEPLPEIGPLFYSPTVIEVPSDVRPVRCVGPVLTVSREG